MVSQTFRYEMNQKVRSVLVRHGVDLTGLRYSFVGRTLYLSGTLVKAVEGDFRPREVETLVREIMEVPGIRQLHSELNNWIVIPESETWVLRRRRKHLPGGTPEEQEPLVIHKEEDLEEVLKDQEGDEE